jgi:hypothetical protein
VKTRRAQQLPEVQPADEPVLTAITPDPSNRPANGQAPDAPRMQAIAIHNLDGLAPTLAALAPAPDDVILVLPAAGSQVMASAERLFDAAAGLEGGIAVATSPIQVCSTEMAARMSDAVARATGWTPVSRGRGWRPARSQPYPYGLLGPAAALTSLAADCAGLPKSGDADHVAALVLEGRHALVLDVAASVFHVLDATGTDAVAVGGVVHAGGQEPLVLIDPSESGASLARIQGDMGDAGAYDLARLLRYDDAVDERADVFVPAPDILLTPFWTPGFCAMIVRAAEAAAWWQSDGEGPDLRLQTSLYSISPHLFDLVAADFQARIWPRLASQWPGLTGVELEDVLVVRQDAGEADSPLTPPEGAMINGSVQLNEGYEGGGLGFPRQQWDDTDVPVGVLTLWPSTGTHPHWVDWVRQGVRYELSLRWQDPRAVRRA